MTTTRLWLIRHGETAWNAEGRVQGQTDVPLNETGLAQAQAVCRAVAGETFAAIYSSDLLRVRQTAQPSATLLGLPFAPEAGLRERHFGKFETLTYVEVKQNFPEEYERFRVRDPAYDLDGGEALQPFSERALGAVKAIVRRHPGQSVLVFTHGGVLEMVYRHAKGLALSAPRDFEIPNAAINRVDAGPDGWRVLQWSERGHLEDALDDLPG